MEKRYQVFVSPTFTDLTDDPAPQPALCWALTEAGRTALAELLAEKRQEV
ncbi:MAG: hypothetical protein ABSC05_01755 [Candidatus Solibacter sp.]|jgi:hypothetical protein